jgi:hypothetical protein
VPSFDNTKVIESSKRVFVTSFKPTAKNISSKIFCHSLTPISFWKYFSYNKFIKT